MKVVFIRGPFRAANAWLVEQNIRRAEHLAFEVARLGVMPLCPHTNTRFFDGTLTEQFWLEGTKELLRRCDAVVSAPGWESSTGSIGEGEDAERLGIPVFDSIYELAVWLRRKQAE